MGTKIKVVMLAATLALVGGSVVPTAQADSVPPHQAPGVPVDDTGALQAQPTGGCTVAHWHEAGFCAAEHVFPTWACVHAESLPRATEDGWENSLSFAIMDLNTGDYIVGPSAPFTRFFPYPESPTNGTLGGGTCTTVDHLPTPVRVACIATGKNSTGTIECELRG